MGGICSDLSAFVPRVGAFVQESSFFGIPIQNVGDLQHKIIPRGQEFVKQLLPIPTMATNPHLCLIWVRWGVTMIDVLTNVELWTAQFCFISWLHGL